MRVLGLLILGFVLAGLQGELVHLTWMPPLAALMLSFLLLRVEAPRLWLKALALTTGCAAGSTLPLGAWWLAAGLSALPIIGMRGLLFVRHPAIQALAAGWTACSFLLAGALAALLDTGAGPVGRVWSPGNAWTVVGVTLLAGPLVHPVLEALAVLLPGRALPSFPRDGAIQASRMLE